MHSENITLEDIKRFVKSDLKKIEHKGYSCKDIFSCVEDYLQKREGYQEIVETFSKRIQRIQEINASFAESVWLLEG